MTTLADAHVTAQVQLRDAVTDSTLRVWDALPNHDKETVPLFLNTVLPLIEAGERQSIALVDGYMAHEMGRAAYGLDPAPLLPVRFDVAMSDLYQRPFIQLWSELKEGQLWMDANEHARERLRVAIRTDMVIAQNLAGAVVVARDPNVYGLQRVLHGTCDLCVSVLNQGTIYQPIHPGCECAFAPITKRPAHYPRQGVSMRDILNRENLPTFDTATAEEVKKLPLVPPGPAPAAIKDINFALKHIGQKPSVSDIESVRPLTAEEVRNGEYAAEEYFGNSWNEILLEGKGEVPPGFTREAVYQANTRRLDRLIEGQTPSRGGQTLWRGLRPNSKLDFFPNRLQAGDQLENPGFLSTTENRDLAAEFADHGVVGGDDMGDGVLLRIHTTQDLPNYDVETLMKAHPELSEDWGGPWSEVLFGRGQVLRVIKRTVNPNGPDILDVELGPARIAKAIAARPAAPEAAAERAGVQAVSTVSGVDEKIIARIVQLHDRGMSYRKIRDELELDFSHAKVRSIYELAKSRTPGQVEASATRAAATRGAASETARLQQLVREAEAAARSADTALARARAARIEAERLTPAPETGGRLGDHIVRNPHLSADGRDTLKRTEDYISRVHDVPTNARDVTFEVSKTPAAHGNLPKGGTPAGQYDPNGVGVWLQTGSSYGDYGLQHATHEFGHYMDYMLGSRWAGLSQMQPPDLQMRAVLDAINNSRAMKHLKSQWDSGAQGKYATDPREEFARAYTQWIGTKMPGTNIMRTLSGSRMRQGMQWDPADFRPISEAMDDLFRSRGLLHEGT